MKKIFFLKLILVYVSSCAEHPDLGKGYKLTRNTTNGLSIINSLDLYLIYGDILNYTFDSTFIIACERPRDSILECSGTIPKMTKRKCNEAFEKSTFKQYWIINKKEESNNSYDSIREVAIYSNVYGPYKREEYLRKRKELGIPTKLVLD
jgi:hypothetical protein